VKQLRAAEVDRLADVVPQAVAQNLYAALHG